MNAILSRLGWVISGALGLFVVMSVTGAANGGPLDPPEPVGSTMRTLDALRTSWHRVAPSSDGPNSCNSSRFECVMDGVAVLDNETGLVWDRTPNGSDTLTWENTFLACVNLNKGGRLGWRVPTVGELASLMHQSITNPSLSLPAGHPFQVSGTATFWTATRFPTDPSAAMYVQFLGDTLFSAGHTGVFPVTTQLARWCVRGGSGRDGA